MVLCLPSCAALDGVFVSGARFGACGCRWRFHSVSVKTIFLQAVACGGASMRFYLGFMWRCCLLVAVGVVWVCFGRGAVRL